MLTRDLFAVANHAALIMKKRSERRKHCALAV